MKQAGSRCRAGAPSSSTNQAPAHEQQTDIKPLVVGHHVPRRPRLLAEVALRLVVHRSVEVEAVQAGEVQKVRQRVHERGLESFSAMLLPGPTIASAAISRPL